LDEVDDENSNVADKDPSAADEKIWQSFGNLKEVVNNLEFPVELLQQLAASKSSVKEEIDQSKDTLEELVAPSVAKFQCSWRQSFGNLKEVMNNLEFPVELLQQLAASKSSDKEEIDQSKDTLEELVAPSVADENKTPFKRPSSKKKSREGPAKCPSIPLLL
jgi:cell division protein FtsB